MRFNGRPLIALASFSGWPAEEIDYCPMACAWTPVSDGVEGENLASLSSSASASESFQRFEGGGGDETASAS